jgi:hypothetical protein
MAKETAIKLFNQKQVRCHWDNEKEKWYFSIVDVVGVLSDSENPQTYSRVLKKRLLAEGNETVTNCNALKMHAESGGFFISCKLLDIFAVKGITLAFCLTFTC